MLQKAWVKLNKVLFPIFMLFVSKTGAIDKYSLLKNDFSRIERKANLTGTKILESPEEKLVVLLADKIIKIKGGAVLPSADGFSTDPSYQNQNPSRNIRRKVRGKLDTKINNRFSSSLVPRPGVTFGNPPRITLVNANSYNPTGEEFSDVPQNQNVASCKSISMDTIANSLSSDYFDYQTQYYSYSLSKRFDTNKCSVKKFKELARDPRSNYEKYDRVSIDEARAIVQAELENRVIEPSRPDTLEAKKVDLDYKEKVLIHLLMLI